MIVDVQNLVLLLSSSYSNSILYLIVRKTYLYIQEENVEIWKRMKREEWKWYPKKLQRCKLKTIKIFFLFPFSFLLVNSKFQIILLHLGLVLRIWFIYFFFFSFPNTFGTTLDSLIYFDLILQSDNDFSLTGVPLTALYFAYDSRILISGDQSGMARWFLDRVLEI